MSISDLIAVLTQIREGIADDAYPNETAVRTQIVQRILHQLGWDVFDPDRVCNEFSLKLETKTRRIDLALCIFKGKPRCIIELKATDYDLKQIGRSSGDKQLFEYAFHAGAPLALLTNGANWRFYSTFSAGTYEERLVRALDIRSEPPEDIAIALDRYISHENTKSGKSAHYAVEDLQERVNRQKAREAIPEAWAHLVESDPENRLVTLLSEATSALGERAPAKQDIMAFLGTLKSTDSAPWRKHEQESASTPRQRTTAVLKPALSVKESVTPATRGDSAESPGARAVHYYLFGEERIAKSARDAYVVIFRSFADRDPDLLRRAEPRLRGHKNRGVSKIRHELASNPSMVSSAVAIANGWWLLTKMSNAQKVFRLKVLCEIAGVRFGDREGLYVDFPNA